MIVRITNALKCVAIVALLFAGGVVLFLASILQIIGSAIQIAGVWVHSFKNDKNF